MPAFSAGFPTAAGYSDTQLVRRAGAAWSRLCRASGALPQQPSNDSEVRQVAGQRCVVLRNTSGILAVYQCSSLGERIVPASQNTPGARRMNYAPVYNIQIDARADQGAIFAGVSQMLEHNNRQIAKEFERRELYN